MKITAWYNDERFQIEIEGSSDGMVEIDHVNDVKNKSSTASCSGPPKVPYSNFCR